MKIVILIFKILKFLIKIANRTLILLSYIQQEIFICVYVFFSVINVPKVLLQKTEIKF